MQLFSLAIVFVAIIVLLGLRRPLYQAISGGLVLMVLLFRIPLTAAISGILNVFTNWGSFSILVSLYLVTYLQRILEARSQIKLAQQDQRTDASARHDHRRAQRRLLLVGDDLQHPEHPHLDHLPQQLLI